MPTVCLRPVLLALLIFGDPTSARSSSAKSDVAPSICIGEPVARTSVLGPGRLSTEDGDIVLSDGTKARIAGLIWHTDGRTTGTSTTAWQTFVKRVEALTQSGNLLLAPANGSPDRWGRSPIHLVVAGILGSEVALSAGLATLRPGDLPVACRRALLAVEAEARMDRRGRWGLPNSVFDATRPADIVSQTGRYIIVEGRVRGLGETSARVYLNFGNIRSESFSISIPKASLRRFEASGMRWTSLEGRRVRVRGVVLDRGGPLVEIGGPDELERLD